MTSIPVVGMGGGEVAHGRLGLGFDVLLVIVDGEGRLEAVDHLVDHDRRDLDGVAVGVVDLELLGFEVAYPQ